MRLFLLAAYVAAAQAVNVVLTNDDGWAVALIRAQYNALKSGGYNVVLSAPADNKSGTGSTTSIPTTRTSACEFNSCPAGSPAYGYNASDPRLNYVNGYPADSAKYGIQILSPKFFGGPPDLIVSGPNVGLNTGTTVNVSGTVGAAVEAAREGLPAIAFSASGDSTSQVSYTTLTSSPTSSLTVSANIYSNLTVKFVNAVLANTTKPYVPAGTIINVNFPATTRCTSVSSFKFVLARALANSAATDVTTCGSSHLPSEGTVVGTSGCYASVSVISATNKADVGASTQKLVLDRLRSFLSCLP